MNCKRCISSLLTRYIKHTIITTQLMVLVFLFMHRPFLHQNEFREKLNPNPNIILMGQFNYFSSNITTWIDAWSKVIDRKNIVIAAPCPEPERCMYPTGLYPTITPSKYVFYTHDHNSGRSPIVNMIKVIRETDNMDGILYAHDDLLLTSYIFDKIGGHEWIGTNFEPQSVQIYENSSFVSSINYTKWLFWEKCRSSFSNMFHESRLKPYLHRSKNGDLYMNITTGQSDMLYAVFPSFEIKHSFIDILELFAEHRVWLECAIPTAVLMMQERFGIKFHNTPLCTTFSGPLRKKPKLLIEHCATEMNNIRANRIFGKRIEKYGVYHPIKMSFVSDWTQYFDQIRRS